MLITSFVAGLALAITVYLFFDSLSQENKISKLERREERSDRDILILIAKALDNGSSSVFSDVDDSMNIGGDELMIRLKDKFQYPHPDSSQATLLTAKIVESLLDHLGLKVEEGIRIVKKPVEKK